MLAPGAAEAQRAGAKSFGFGALRGEHGLVWFGLDENGTGPGSRATVTTLSQAASLWVWPLLRT